VSDAPLVSIIINNYNYGRYLDDAIDSALCQTHSNVEIVVVDDGSTDDSRAIIASYERRIIPVLKENAGMASTYNAGLAASGGDLVLFLDSDDVLLPSAAEQAAVRATGKPVTKVHWPLRVIDALGRPTRRVVPQRTLEEGDLRERVVRLGPDSYASPPTTGNAWSRRFLENVLPVPEAEFRQHADVYLTTLAPLFGPIAKVAEPLGCYRVHGQNDYACRSVAERNERNLSVYDYRCRALSKYLGTLGMVVPPDTWKAGNDSYGWMERLRTALVELVPLIPAGESFLLVDGGQWGCASMEGGLIDGRRTIPFLERDGQYWGPPADDEIAIQELERLRRTGAAFIVFAWSAFWWLDYYAAFHRYLRSRFPCRLHDDRLCAFDLQPKSGLSEWGTSS
jgi:glycosyltransferase involved in cell wall biosynthesis